MWYYTIPIRRISHSVVIKYQFCSVNMIIDQMFEILKIIEAHHLLKDDVRNNSYSPCYHQIDSGGMHTPAVEW